MIAPEKAQDTALNGAQVQAATEIVANVIGQPLPRSGRARHGRRRSHLHPHPH